MIAATATREEKQNWLLRPFSLAADVAWLSASFGAVHYFYRLVDHTWIVGGLVIALATIAALLLWGMHRMHVATR